MFMCSSCSFLLCVFYQNFTEKGLNSHPFFLETTVLSTLVRIGDPCVTQAKDGRCFYSILWALGLWVDLDFLLSFVLFVLFRLQNPVIK